MTPFVLSAVACLVASAHLNMPPVLLRAAIVAGRATVVVVDQQAFNYKTPIDLHKTACDGPGHEAGVGCVDLTPPWRQSTLRFPARLGRGGLPYPRVLLRHSHSRHGLYVVNHHFLASETDYGAGLRGASIPLLDGLNEQLRGPAVKHTAAERWWRSFEDGGVSGVPLDPLQVIPPFHSKERGQLRKSLYYDFLVTDAADCELFLAQHDGSVQCYVKSVLFSRLMVEPGGAEIKPWDKPYLVPGDIAAPFAVLPHKKSRYLVTPAGTLAKLCDAGKPLDRLAVVYDKSPVRAVVHDADEGAWYAFTATHFFEVAEPVTLKPHGVKAFDTSSGAAGLETAFHSARAVRGLPPIAFPAAK